MANRLALIPARGGSKGIKDKNLQKVGDKSLLQRAIHSARQTGLFSEICVSTDSEVIAAIAIEEGASVPFLRPRELSSDSTLGLEVIRHAIQFYSSNGKSFTTITLLQPTSPFRDAQDILRATELFESSSFESLISVLEVTQMQPSTLYRSILCESDGKQLSLDSFETRDEFKYGTLRQTFVEIYWRNGAIYIFKPKNLEQYPVLLKEPIGGFAMDWIKSINIDEPKDLEKARLISASFGV